MILEALDEPPPSGDRREKVDGSKELHSPIHAFGIQNGSEARESPQELTDSSFCLITSLERSGHLASAPDSLNY